MANVSSIANTGYASAVKPKTPPPPPQPRQEEVREPAAEARQEARSRTEEAGPANSQVGTRINTTA